ncbi:MAG: putative ABC transporter ATP-binding protein [Methanonatronarchaeales archaeon]|nr:putative ABC transporter ATP-binding protein [Methanonatronarchaeales archaeon]
MIETRGLTYTYRNGETALRDVSIRVERESFTAVLGPNGAGKSTLLQHFNGLLEPSSGEVLVDGVRLGRDNARDVRRRVGMVFQNPDDQLFEPTVRADVEYGPRNLGVAGEELEERVEEALGFVGMREAADGRIDSQSLGEKKRVAIAGILAMKPDVIVMDEPLAHLDTECSEEIIEVLASLHREGRTVVVATHDTDAAYGLADRVCVLRDGRILAQGPSEEALGNRKLMRRVGARQPLALRMRRELAEAEAPDESFPRDPHRLLDQLTSGEGRKDG